MNWNSSVLAVVGAPAILALCGSFSPKEEGDWPLVCTAVPTGMAGGINIGPPGTSF